jgi:hypothetical protein
MYYPASASFHSGWRAARPRIERVLYSFPAMLHALVASLALAAVMTFGDFFWAALNLRHRVLYGVVHGAVMCLFIGVAIGIRTRRPAAGALAGPLIGVIAAGAFYVLAPWLRLTAMFPAWMVFWICFALLQAKLAREGSLRSAIVQGLVAATLSGIAFYLISGIWTRHDPAGPNYVWNFIAWSFAFFPGFAVLFWKKIGR